MKSKRFPVLTVAVVAAVSLLLPSCKGRTLDNVEPTGETVEVVVNAADTVASAVN